VHLVGFIINIYIYIYIYIYITMHGPLNVKLLKISFLSDDVSVVTSLTDPPRSDAKTCFKMFQRTDC